VSALNLSPLHWSAWSLSLWYPRCPRQRFGFPLTKAGWALGLMDPDITGGAL
jgi:hypothetical protein